MYIKLDVMSLNLSLLVLTFYFLNSISFLLKNIRQAEKFGWEKKINNMQQHILLITS